MAKLEILQCAVGPKGDVYSLQTGGRIVRHGNPKTKDTRVEVVYEARERLDGLWVSPTGALHAVGKRYHTNAGGIWRKELVPVADDLDILLAVWAPDDDTVWVGSEEGEVLCRRDGVWKAIPVGLPKADNFIYAIRGTTSGEVYVTSDEGVAYFDGTKWQKAKLSSTHHYLDVLPRNGAPSIVVGRDGPILFAGKSARLERVKDISGDPTEDFYSVAERGKDVYIATGSRLLAWNGKTVRDAIAAAPDDGPYLSCLYVASNGDVVAATSATGVHIFDGRGWTFSPAQGATKAVKVRKKRATAKAARAQPMPPPKRVPSTTSRGPRRFELSSGRSRKFWQIAISGSTLVIRFGRIGTAGDGVSRPLASSAAAKRECDKLIAERMKEGYVEK